MADPDQLYDIIFIGGRMFETFTELHMFIREKYPGNLADSFQRQYSKSLSPQHSNVSLARPSDLDRLYSLPTGDPKVMDCKKQYQCNFVGAWLILSLQNDENPDVQNDIITGMTVEEVGVP